MNCRIMGFCFEIAQRDICWKESNTTTVVLEMSYKLVVRSVLFFIMRKTIFVNNEYMWYIYTLGNVHLRMYNEGVAPEVHNI